MAKLKKKKKKHISTLFTKLGWSGKIKGAKFMCENIEQQKSRQNFLLICWWGGVERAF